MSWINTFFFMNEKKKPLGELGKESIRLQKPESVFGGRKSSYDAAQKPTLGRRDGCGGVTPQ